MRMTKNLRIRLNRVTGFGLRVRFIYLRCLTRNPQHGTRNSFLIKADFYGNAKRYSE
jgi:hypothetical protein